jgi:hypothetical protein
MQRLRSQRAGDDGDGISNFMSDGAGQPSDGCQFLFFNQLATRRFQIIELLMKLLFAITQHVNQQPHQASDEEVHQH